MGCPSPALEEEVSAQAIQREPRLIENESWHLIFDVQTQRQALGLGEELQPRDGTAPVPAAGAAAEPAGPHLAAPVATTSDPAQPLGHNTRLVFPLPQTFLILLFTNS